MVYLDSFVFPGQQKEEDIFNPKSVYFLPKTRGTAYTTIYPFGIFRYRDLPKLIFEDVTIFCGGNGSGKSTILNVIAEKLRLQRGCLYNRSDFYEDYTRLCAYSPAPGKELPEHSAIITSDDVFEMMQDTRHINDGIDRRRDELIKEYIDVKGCPNNDDERFKLHGLDDFDRFKRTCQMRSRSDSQSSFLRRELMRNLREFSNGESALQFFVERIRDNGLYLLDEPENSLSPANQIKLKYFLEDCVRAHGCQFVIASHSPFMLSLAHARIYDLDADPPDVKKWTELENVRVYRDFFLEHEGEFD